MSKLQFKGNAVKFCRYGSDNAVKQFSHKKLPSDFRRGVWAFPYPYMDMFFVVHRMKNYVKAESIWNFENPHPRYDAAKSKEDYEKKAPLFKRTFTTFWWDGPLLSRIGEGAHPGCVELDGWFLWSSAREWARFAVKTLPSSKYRFSRDHLEVFCPMKGK